MTIQSKLKKEALRLSQKALEKLMADERRAMQIANVVGTVQRGKQALDRGQDQLMRALNFAAKGDFKALGKRLSALKRRVRDVEEKLDQVGQRRATGH